MAGAGPARRRQIVQGLVALIALIIIVVGVPILLVNVMPLIDLTPHGWPSLDDLQRALAERDTGQLAAAALVLTAWLCWALFTISLVPEVVGAVRRRPAVPLPGFVVFQRPAAVLIAFVAIGFGLAPTMTLGLAYPAARPSLPSVTTSFAAASTVGQQLPAAATPPTTPRRHSPSSAATAPISEPAAPPATTAATYTVRRHDTLWAIAEHHLGNPLRYLEIVALNAAVIGPDNEIYPGTVLTLPPDATGLPATTVDTVEVTVDPGDTLAGIVEDLTGSQDWQSAWQLNAGRAEPDGAVFVDPDLIRPGWSLSIPVQARLPAETTAPHPDQDDHGSAPGQTTPHGKPAAPPTPEPVSTSTSPPPISEAPTAAGTPAGNGAQTLPSAINHEVVDAERDAGGGASTTVFATAGGLVLAAGTLTALIAYRRRQQRHRRPGRVVASPPPSTAALEREIRGVGDAQRLRVDVLHELLLDLADACHDRALPEVEAVRFAVDEVTLLLANPDHDPPTGWVSSEGDRHWTTTLQVGGYPGRTDRLPPFPLLVSIGHEDAEASWLLNLERARPLRLSGDRARCVDLARFIAAELAHNAWAELVEVTHLGVGVELVQINPDRLRCLDHAEPWPRDAAGEPWVRQVLIDASGGELPPRFAPGTTAVVVSDTGDSTDDGYVQVGSDGTLAVPRLGLELIAEQLPADEAAVIADLLASAANLEDRPMPAGRGDRGSDPHIDASGVPNIESPMYRRPDHPPGVHAVRVEGRDAVLPLAPSAYEASAATTSEDVLAMSPPVPSEVRAENLESDPTLHADVDDWFAESCPRPRIGVLGSITVRCSGRLPERSPQESLHTEAAVFLALHPGGVAPHVFAEALWPHDPDAAGKSKVHAAITRLRKWLGRDPGTGREYLPSNADDPWNAKYVIENVLVDADLFRRLRTRGILRGEEGIDDLSRALSLVTGPPFHNAPTPRPAGPGGYGWLTDGNSRLDNEYIAMIVDTAHTVSTFYLANGMPERAAEASHVARSTGSFDDIPLLDLVKAALDLGHDAEADAWIQQILTNNDAEIEEDLPPRTAEILFRLHKQWRQGAGATG